MDSKTSEMNAWRLSSQQLLLPQWQQPERIVEWLGGVQAQYYDWALWSIGLRMREGSAPEVQRAIAGRRVVRTWAFRGTLHFVAASDLSWLIPLLAPAVIAANARRYKQLELNEAGFDTSQQVIRRALEPGVALGRSEIARVLEDAGMSAKGQRMPYFLQRAALDGLICHGLPQGREPTYVLLAQWIEPQESLRRDEALAALAERYMVSHGPASVQDLAWWSGLPAAAARQALESAPSAVQIAFEGAKLWAAQEPPLPPPQETAYLLSPFDDYLLGYKDRSWALDPAFAKRVNAGGGMPRPTIVLNGEVVGTWRRAIKKDRLVVTTDLFRELPERERRAVRAAARRYGDFHSLPTETE